MHTHLMLLCVFMTTFVAPQELFVILQDLFSQVKHVVDLAGTYFCTKSKMPMHEKISDRTFVRIRHIKMPTSKSGIHIYL